MDDDVGDCVAAAVAGVEHKPKEPLMQLLRSSAAAAAAAGDFAAVVGAVVGMPLVFFRWIQSLAGAVGVSALVDWRAWQERNLKRLGKRALPPYRQHRQIERVPNTFEVLAQLH